MAKASNTESSESTQTHEHHSNLLAVFTATLAVFLVLVISLGTWAKNNLFNTQEFSNHVVTAVQTESVRNAIAEGVTNKLYANYPIASRILSKPTESFISSQLGTDRAGNILGKLATNLQNRAIHGNSKPVVIDISGLTQTLAAMRETIAPDSEPRFTLPQGEDARIVILKGDEVPNLKTTGMIILTVTPFATAGLIALAVIAWFKTKRKARYFMIAGTVMIVSGGLLLIFTSTAASQLSLIAQNASQATILEAIYNEFIGNLQRWQTILISWGFVVVIVTALVSHRQQITAFAKKVMPTRAK